MARSNVSRTLNEERPGGSKNSIRFERDVVAVLETNLDDVTGETLGRAIERLVDEGALDATVANFIGKKGRPGQTVRVVCRRDSVERLAEVLVEETGTFGVKTTEYTRLVVPRRVVSVPVVIGNFRGVVSVKVAGVKGKLLRVKPELDEARRISESQKMPLRNVVEQITLSAREYISSSLSKDSSRSSPSSHSFSSSSTATEAKGKKDGQSSID